MKPITHTVAGLLLLAAFAAPAGAAVLTLVPESPAVSLGETFEVAARISALGNGIEPSLSAYDLEIGFDPARLAFSGVVFGDPVLGSQLDIGMLGSLSVGGLVGAGVARFVEVSFASVNALNLLQPEAFTLFTATFTALTAGPAFLSLDVDSLADAAAQPLPVTASGTTVSVPLPGTPLLLAAGLLPLLGRGGQRPRG